MKNANLDRMLDRRDFVVGSLLAALGGMTITISGCGGESPTAPTAPTTGRPTDVTGTIAANHGHVVVITGALLSARGALSLSIQGSAAHDHTVELSAEEVARVWRGQRVVKESSGTRHTHTVTFNDDVPPTLENPPVER